MASEVEATGLGYPEARGNLPRSGIQPVSPALAGGLFITEPPGKSCNASQSTPRWQFVVGNAAKTKTLNDYIWLL